MRWLGQQSFSDVDPCERHQVASQRGPFIAKRAIDEWPKSQAINRYRNMAHDLGKGAGDEIVVCSGSLAAGGRDGKTTGIEINVGQRGISIEKK